MPKFSAGSLRFRVLLSSCPIVSTLALRNLLTRHDRSHCLEHLLTNNHDELVPFVCLLTCVFPVFFLIPNHLFG